MTTSFEFLRSVMHETLSVAAQTAAYPSWSDEFSRKEVREVWSDLGASLRRRRGRVVPISELQRMKPEHLDWLGFCTWKGNYRLIPLWAWNYIENGAPLKCIDGEIVAKSEACDLDVRVGCVAYGFEVLV